MKVRDAKLAVIIGTGLLFASPLAYADNNNSVTLTPSGTIADACTVALTNSNASLGDLSAGGNVTIGTVTETCNDPKGYKVNLTSANKGALKAASGGSVAYTLAYGNTTSVNLSTGAATVTTATGPTSTPVPNDVKLSWPVQSSLLADTYTDTLTFTMAAN